MRPPAVHTDMAADAAAAAGVHAARRERVSAVALVLLVTAVGLALAGQGWRQRIPGTDSIPSIDGARALLAEGRLPERGVVTSRGSYAPPGLAWVVVPGAWALRDVRTVDMPGMAALFAGTLAGVYLLARACAGPGAAALAVLFVGVSETGLAFAATFGDESAGPRGHPFFMVWMTYWTCRWVTRQDPRCLALAILTWAAGMYVFMEIAPAVLMLPAAWLLFRPPVSARSLAPALLVAGILWAPYLRFEAGRHYADLRSQLTLQNISPQSPALAYCTPGLRAHAWPGAPLDIADDQPAAGPARWLVFAGRRVLAIEQGLTANTASLVPGASVVMSLLTLVALAGATASRVPRRAAGAGAIPPRMSRWQPRLGVLLLVLSVAANEVVVRWASGALLTVEHFPAATVRGLQALLAAGSLGLLMRPWVRRALSGVAWRAARPRVVHQVVALALLLPWLVLLGLAEWGRADRLAFLWPLQAVVLATGVWGALGATRWRGIPAHWTLSACLLAALATNSTVVTRAQRWRADGWAGQDAPEVALVDRMAAHLRTTGRDAARIGYRLLPEREPVPPFQAADARWGLGAPLDALLEYRHGLRNATPCPEGLTPHDDLRVVQRAPLEPQAPAVAFDVAPAGRLVWVDQVNGYDLFRSAD